LSDERQAETGNDASLVTLFSYEDLDILFTGDMGKDYWSEILPLEGIEILKVPHHGSRNSWYDGVYAAFQTEAAIISAGINNRYGHPHEEVLRELGEQGNRIFRTDQAGAIILEKSNAIYRVTTFLP
jgi:competence protein ComEC